MNDNETPMHKAIAEAVSKDFDLGESSTIHALSSISFAVDQVVELFGQLVEKLQPILTADGGMPTAAEGPTAPAHSYVFQQILGNELKLNDLCQHIQDVTRRVDL